MNNSQYSSKKSLFIPKSSKQGDAHNWSAYDDSVQNNTIAQAGNDKPSIAYNQEKEYSKKIHDNLETIFFRLDFIPTSDKLASEIVDYISKNDEFGSNKGTRNPDKSILTHLDGDSIAEVLGISLTDLYKFEITSFNDISIGKYKCVVCVHRYFISLEIKNVVTDVPKEDFTNDELIKTVFAFFNDIVSSEFFRVFELDLYLGLSYMLKKSESEILKIIDNTAFPILKCPIQDGLFRNITYKNDDPFIAVELIRSLKIIKDNNNENIAYVIIQSRTVSEINDRNNYFSPPYDQGKNILDLSKKTITRCFNKDE